MGVAALTAAEKLNDNTVGTGMRMFDKRKARSFSD
jgi:hypothetical protein